MKKILPRFKIGDKVKSRYLNPWHGIIVGWSWCISHDNSHPTTPLFYIVPVLTKRGLPQQRMTIHCLNQYWLEASTLTFNWPSNWRIEDIQSLLRSQNHGIKVDYPLDKANQI